MATKLIIPTPINLLLLFNQNLVANRRRGQTAELVLPPLRELARLALGENEVLEVNEEEVQTNTFLSR